MIKKIHFFVAGIVLLFLFGFFLFGNLSNVSFFEEGIFERAPITAFATSVSTCQTLSTTNEVYFLDQSISGIGGTCFIISAENVTLDLNGYELNGTGGNLSSGVFISSSGNYATVRNGSLNHFLNGIQVEANYTTFYNLDFSEGNNPYFIDTGIYFFDNGYPYYGANLTSLNFYRIEGEGINVGPVSYAFIIDKIYAKDNFNGVFFYYGADNFTFSNLNLVNNTDDSLSFYGVNNSVFTNISLSSYFDSFDDGLLYLEASNNNVFYGLNITTNSSTNIGVYDSYNNSFVSSNFDLDKEYVDSGEIFRKWYLNVQVNDSSGYLESGNVSIYDLGGNFVYSALTDSSGEISRQILTEYLTNSSGRFFYTPHDVNISKTNYVSNLTSINLSVENDFYHFVLLSSGDCTYSGSGDWVVDCGSFCNITSNVDVGGNDVFIQGAGRFLTTANITNYGKLHIEGDDSNNLCRVTCINGGCFKG